MAIELSSAGVQVRWAVETIKGTRPTTGYKKITGIKSIPDLNPETSSLEVTDLSDTQYKRYIGGLKDTGGSLAFKANHSEDFMTDWNSLISTYEEASAAESGKRMWFEIYIPKLTKAFFMSVVPQPLGLSAIEVDAVLEIDAYVAPQEIAGWETASTNPAT